MPGTPALRDAQIALAEKAALKLGGAQPIYDLAGAFLAQGDAKTAAELCRRAYARDPTMAPIRQVLAAGGAEPAMIAARARALIDHNFLASPLLADYAVAAAQTGDAATVGRLIDYAQFLKTCFLHPGARPELGELADEIKRAARFIEKPKGGAAIRQAWRYDDVCETAAAPVVRRLLADVRGAVQSYIDGLPDDPDDPFLAAKPKQFTLNGWGIVSGSAGRHAPHIHHRSWASIVYYVSVPPIADDENARVGWLRLGAPPWVADPATVGWEERWVKPQPDLLAIFPSHFYHDTRPLGVDQERICVPVDVIPA